MATAKFDIIKESHRARQLAVDSVAGVLNGRRTLR
jgi:hypothetical protein